MIIRTVDLPGYESCAGRILQGAMMLPEDAQHLFVMAHGAGAGYDHANMLGIAQALAANNIGTLRFNFPFMQDGKRRVD